MSYHREQDNGIRTFSQTVECDMSRYKYDMIYQQRNISKFHGWYIDCSNLESRTNDISSYSNAPIFWVFGQWIGKMISKGNAFGTVGRSQTMKSEALNSKFQLTWIKL